MQSSRGAGVRDGGGAQMLKVYKGEERKKKEGWASGSGSTRSEEGGAAPGEVLPSRPGASEVDGAAARLSRPRVVMGSDARAPHRCLGGFLVRVLGLFGPVPHRG